MKRKRNKPSAYRTNVGGSIEDYLYVQSNRKEQVLGMLCMRTIPKDSDEMANLLQWEKVQKDMRQKVTN